MTIELDDLLRESLNREADDVVAGPELYARIETATTGRDRRSTVRRVGPWLLAAAAAAVVAGLLATLPEDDQRVTTPPATAPTPSTTPARAVPRPDRVAAVLDDGRLVTIDVDSGAITELYALDDPRDSEGTAEPDPSRHSITDVAVSPDGRTVYFGTSGGSGGVYRVPIDGSSDPERLGPGWGVTVSSDGQRLAFAYTSEWGVYDIATGASKTYPLPSGEASPVVSISPDGSEVQVVSFETDSEAEHAQVHTINERMDRTSTRDGIAGWQSTRFADGSGRWLLEIVERSGGGNAINWGTSADGLTTAIPNPEGLVVETVDW